MLTALLAVPVAGAVGLAIDYGHALYEKQRLDTAAAAAAATGANSARFAYQQSGATFANEDAAAFVEGRTRAAAAFSAHSESVGGVAVSGTPSVTVSRSGSVVSASVNYSASVPTTLGNLFGFRTIGISGRAAASATVVQSTPSSSYVLQETFETVPSPMQNGTWGVYQNYNGWTTTGSGVEIDQDCTTACNTPEGRNSAELDSNGNSAMSKLVTLAAGKYELRYWCYSRVDNPYYDPAWVCGSTDADVDWSNDTSNGWGALTNKIGVYLDPSSGSTPNLSWSNAQSGYVGSNLIESCAWSGQKWIERSVSINVVAPGAYWLTFTALGANDTFGGLLDNIRLCQGSCSGTPRENFPWAANTLLFVENFTNSSPGFLYRNGSNVILDASGQATGWSQPMAGWTTWPLDQMDWLTGLAAPDGSSSGHPIELAASQATNAAITRKFLLDPGYYKLEYYYSSRLYAATGMPSGALCGMTIPLESTYAANTYTGRDLEAGGYMTKPGDLGKMSAYIDADRLVSHPTPPSSPTLGSTATFRNYDGSTTNLADALPQNRLETCLYSSANYAKRTLNLQIDKPGYYWITMRAEGPDPLRGAIVGSIRLTGLGGLSTAAPSGVLAVPAPGPAAGATISMNGFYLAAQ